MKGLLTDFSYQHPDILNVLLKQKTLTLHTSPPLHEPPCKSHCINISTVSVLDVLRVYYQPQLSFGFCSPEVIKRYCNYKKENRSYPQKSELFHLKPVALRMQLSSQISQLWWSTLTVQVLRRLSRKQPGQCSKIPIFKQQLKPFSL